MSTAPASVLGAIALVADVDLEIEEDLLGDPDARVPMHLVLSAWERAAAHDESVGIHFGERIAVGAFPVVDYVTRACATVGEGLARLVRYQRILFDDLHLSLERRRRTTRLTYHLQAPKGFSTRQPAEAALAVFLQRARTFAGENIIPQSVSFAHAAPTDTSEHVRFFAVEPSFRASRTELVLSNVDTALPLLGADHGLLAFLDQKATDELETLPGSASTRSQVRRAITEGMNGEAPTLEMVAATLGISARTVRRKLSLEGTRFTSLLAAVRQERAKHLLRGGLSVRDTAYVLGFSEPSAFVRAFRKWTGMSPARWRAQGQAGEQAPGHFVSRHKSRA